MMKDITKEARDHSAFSNHEKVFAFTDEASGLRGFLAIHSTALGNASGGTRIYHYAKDEHALDDALRLSAAMTKKAALAGVPCGGSKGVIIASQDMKTPEMLSSYGREVSSLGGLVTTGPDLGVTREDVAHMALGGPHILGQLNHTKKTSDYAALGVYYAIISAVQHVFPDEDLGDRSFAVKGVGKIGSRLVSYLYDHGASIFVSDVNKDSLAEIKSRFPDITIVDNDTIHSLEVDVFAPCAIANDINDETVSGLQCKIVAGGANNQLSSAAISKILFDMGIVYVPDYVANSGGLIYIVDELEGDGYSQDRVDRRVKMISRTVADILKEADEKGVSPKEVADSFASRIVSSK